jgi:hypothetical protein
VGSLGEGSSPTEVDGDLRLQRITQASGGLCGIAAFGPPNLVCWGHTFPARRANTEAPSGILGVPATTNSLAGDHFGGRLVHNGRLYRFGYNGGWVQPCVPGLSGSDPARIPNSRMLM